MWSQITKACTIKQHLIFLLIAGCYDGGLYCVSSFTGKVQWTFQTKGMIKCSPVLCNNDMSVIFGSYDFHIYCVNSEVINHIYMVF